MFEPFKIDNPNMDVIQMHKEISDIANKIMKKNRDSFNIVLGLYIGAFVLGALLIIFSFILAKTGTEYLGVSSVLGAAGAADIAFLLYKPAKEIQRSRANAVQLLAAFAEWRYISIWSGKTYETLHKDLDRKQKPEEKFKLIEILKSILELKAKTTSMLISTIQENVASRPVFDKYDLEELDKKIKELENR